MEILSPVKYTRKCPYCQAVLTLEKDEIIWKKTNSVRCPICDEAVFFTDSNGWVEKGVLVEYGLRPEKALKRNGWEK